MQDLFDFSSGLGLGGDGGSFGFDVGPLTADLPKLAETTTEAAVPAAGGGFGDFLSKIGSGLKNEFTAGPLSAFAKSLGLLGTGLNFASLPALSSQLSRQTRTLSRAEKTAEAAATPATAFGKDVLTRARGGTLEPSLQAIIDNWTQQKKADAQALFGQLGLGTSEDLKTYLDHIDQLASEMKGQMLQDQESIGLQALQVGTGAGAAAGGIAQNQQGVLQSLIQSANAQLASLGARQS